MAHFLKKDGQGAYYVFALRAAADITGTILIPAVVAAYIGRLSDARLGTGRTVFIALLILTAFTTLYIVTRKVRAYGKAYQQLMEPPRDGTPRR